jgi:xanthine/uracil permease
LFAFLAAPFISRLLPLFPPVVTGTVILVIGISSVLLDAFFNGVRSIASARSEAAMVAAASGHV